MPHVLLDVVSRAKALHAGGYALPVAVTVALVTIQFALATLPIRPLAWPVVALDTFAITCAVAVATLAAPRGWMLRDRFQMRLATTFGVLAVNGAFFLLTYPGLRDGDSISGAGLMADDPLPSTFFSVLDLWILPIGVALAAHGAARPATDRSATRHAATIAGMGLLGTAIIVAGRTGVLNATQVAAVHPSVTWVIDHLTHVVIAFGLWRLWPLAAPSPMRVLDGEPGLARLDAATPGIDASRRWLAQALVWCLALRLASMIGADVDVARDSAAWYVYRAARAGAFASVVVALIRDGLRLFRTERERMRCWQEVSCGLTGLGMASTVTAMREESIAWLERVFGGTVTVATPGRQGAADASASIDLPALRDPASGASLSLARRRAYSGAECEAIDAFLSGATLSIQRAGEAERAAAVKDEFLAMIGHELRTPLTSLIGYAKLLDDHLAGDARADDEARDYSARLGHHADDLARLITSMLLTSHGLSGVTLPPHESIDIAAMARAVVDAHQSEAARRGLDVVVVPPMESLHAWCAPIFFERVVTILVENAVRYTPSGGRVRVHFDFASSTAPSDAIVAGSTCGHALMVACTVRDTGQGLPAGAETRLFGPFFRRDGSDAQGERGAGLGLYQARRMVELMHGRIEARDHADGGASFTVVLPAA